ncbi:hypothetical protein A9Z42_0004500 [Trichoderma parareesei]|uniref:Uncharacterized protein n=1 Tax=Trichoderma parareesei TaxID=858221 RepID=A0A2H3ACS4_TRIPA|nr:hypothetical protein A9Z42_0004500 [Trichoderma parareesei]
MSTQPTAAALTDRFSRAYAVLRQKRLVYLCEASALQRQTEDPWLVSRGLREVAYELLRVSERLLHLRELMRDCRVDCGVLGEDMDRLTLEIEDGFIRLMREAGEVFRGRGTGTQVYHFFWFYGHE